MGIRYQTGTRDNVIRRACELAIMYEESFLEIISLKYSPSETKRITELTKIHIEDFKRLSQSVLNRNK